MSGIRNFCIIAHIDHGKSTLADRFLELTHTVEQRKMRAQYLDQMDLEREKGITIKLQPVKMRYKDYELNLIDTPGHVDFTYEVSRSLAAVEGALLIIDATQGIQAQTIANLYLALEQGLEIIPVVNKMDLPAADRAKTSRGLISILGCKEEDIVYISAKTGENVDLLLDSILERIPGPPRAPASAPMRALIFDAQYNEFKGIIIYVRLFSGSIRSGDTIKFLKGGGEAEVLEIGCFHPELS